MARIDVTQHGLRGDGATPNSALLDALLKDCSDGSELFFPAGVYYFPQAVRVEGKNCLTLCGDGATLMTHYTPTGPREECNNLMTFTHCTDLTVRDLVVTTDAPIGCAGRVVAVDLENRTYDVHIFDEFPVTGYEHLWASNTCDEDGSPDYVLAAYETVKETTVQQPDGTERKVLVGAVYEVVGDHRIRVQAHPGEPLERLRLGHLINYRYTIYGNSHFCFAYCDRVLLKNIDLYRTPSMGAVICPRCSDFTFDHFCMQVRPGSRELYCSNADGVHIYGLTGYLRFHHCTFNGLGDDALNIHGAAGEISGRLPDGSIQCRRRYYGKEGLFPLDGRWCAPGDVLEVYDRATFHHKGFLTVGSFDADGHAILTQTEGEYAVGDALANTAYFASVHLSHCTVKNTRARGFLLQTHNILVEDCYFFGMSGAGILLSPDIKEWYEVGPSCHTVIRRNVFEKCAFTFRGGMKAAIIVKSCHGAAAGAEDYPAGVHNDMHIVENVFRRTGGSAMYISATDGIEVRGNRFEGNCWRKYDNRTFPMRHDAVLRNCRHVTLAGNSTDRSPRRMRYLWDCTEVEQDD